MGSFHHCTEISHGLRPKHLGFHATIVSTIKPNTWPKSILKLRAAGSKQSKEKHLKIYSYGKLLCSETMSGNNSGWLQILCLCKTPTLFWIKGLIVSCEIGDNLIPVYKGLASDSPICTAALRRGISMKLSACRTARTAHWSAWARDGP